MKRLVVVWVLAIAATSFGDGWPDFLASYPLEHHWAFNNGDLSDDVLAVGANKGNATIIENVPGKYTFNAHSVSLTNNSVGDTWGQVQNVCIGLPSYIIRDSVYGAKTISLWVKDINAEGWQNTLFYLGDGKDGEWGGHPMLRATSRENDKTTVSWFQSQQNPGGGYTQRQFQPNVSDSLHQLVVVCAADNTWVEIYYDGQYKTGWAGVPWEGPGLDQGHNFNDIRNRLGAADDRTIDARWLTGEIYDFSIWGCEMSETDIATLYTLGSEDLLLFIYPGDFNHSGKVDLEDFAILASNWLRTDCNEVNGWCNGIDLNLDHNVDMTELDAVVNHWLYESVPY